MCALVRASHDQRTVREPPYSLSLPTNCTRVRASSQIEVVHSPYFLNIVNRYSTGCDLLRSCRIPVDERLGAIISRHWLTIEASTISNATSGQAQGFGPVFGPTIVAPVSCALGSLQHLLRARGGVPVRTSITGVTRERGFLGGVASQTVVSASPLKAAEKALSR